MRSVAECSVVQCEALEREVESLRNAPKAGR